MGSDGVFSSVGMLAMTAQARVVDGMSDTASAYEDTEKVQCSTREYARSDSFDDPRTLLANMAAALPCSCGATITAVSDSFVDEDEGESLVNIAIARHEADVREICGTRKIYDHAVRFLPPHSLSEDDIVYYGRESTPYWTARVGYGDYLQEVRLRRLDEPNTYSAGRWVHHSSCYLLEPGDVLMATRDIIAATEDHLVIQADSRCTFLGRDNDGDIMLRLASPTRTTIFLEDLLYMTLE
jgi:hypothetical protein